jgi:hypothetical protein
MNSEWLSKIAADHPDDSEIIDRIKERFATGVRIFYPETFEDFCTVEEALKVLASLAAEGELEARTQVYCPEGDLAWEGTPQQFAELEPFRCSDCDQEIDDLKAASVPLFIIPRNVRPYRTDSQTEIARLQDEIKRLRDALTQIADQTELRTKGLMKSARVIARDALEAK